MSVTGNLTAHKPKDGESIYLLEKPAVSKFVIVTTLNSAHTLFQIDDTGSHNDLIYLVCWE